MIVSFFLGNMKVMTVECELKKLLTITFSIDNCNEYCYIDINRPARPLVDFVLQMR